MEFNQESAWNALKVLVVSKENMPVGVLKENEERRLLRGHQWAYRNEFKTLPDLEDGDVFDLFSSERRFVGRAFYQAQGGIAARILSRHQQPIDAGFIKKRLDEALHLRLRLFPGSTVYRWVHGESDLLPGLVVDRYGPVAALQSACAFYRRRFEELARLLFSAADVESALYLNEEETLALGAPFDTLTLSLEGLSVAISLEHSQKTGLFLDQRTNQPVIRRFAAGARVFDGYCYHGLWSCHAALAGAASVLGADTSASALEQAQRNAENNGAAQTCVFVQAKTTDALEEYGPFDVAVLDPPAFAKTRGQAKKALGLYEDINARAMKALAPEGILITCSCSHFLPRDAFMEALKRAGRRAGRHLQVLEVRGASPDHPTVPVMPETEYLKCATLRVL